MAEGCAGLSASRPQGYYPAWFQRKHHPRERVAGHQEKRSSCAGPGFARRRTGVTHRTAIAAFGSWPALVPGGRRLARSLAVLGLVASSAGCILTKDLPDPALDIPEGYKQARSSKAADAPPTLEVRRTFRAPRQRVFDAWTKAEELKRWHSAGPTTVDATEVDLRVGGKWRVDMRSPEGRTYYVSGSYREIDPPNRLVYTWKWDTDLDYSVVTVEFHDLGNATEIVLRHDVALSLWQLFEGLDQGLSSELGGDRSFSV